MSTKTITILECDTCGRRSTASPTIALALDGWTTAYEEHLCPVCSTMHWTLTILQILGGLPDCGSALARGSKTLFLYDLMPPDLDWYNMPVPKIWKR